MEIQSKQLLDDLSNKVNSHIEDIKHMLTIPKNKLHQKSSTKSWSVVECIEHLNLYAIFYNPEFEKRMKASLLNSEKIFKSGIIGNKLAKDILPKEGMKKMKTFKNKNPIYSELSTNIVLGSFIAHQEKLLELLEIAKDKNLSKIKTSTTLPFLKLRIGDTFRFVINHNERHIIQAKNVLKHS